MMFHQMKERGLFPPRYEQQTDTAVPTVTVVLLNESRPEIWEEVGAFLDKNGRIANKDLRKIAKVETLKATRMLKEWVDSGLLVMNGTGKKNTSYRRPTQSEIDARAEELDRLLLDLLR